MITCKAGGDTASVMARMSLLETVLKVQVARAMINWGRNSVESVCRCATLNADAVRQFQTPEDSQFEMNPKHKHKAQKVAGICVQSEDQRKCPRISLFSPGGAGDGKAHVTARFRLCLATPTRRYSSLLP